VEEGHQPCAVKVLVLYEFPRLNMDVTANKDIVKKIKYFVEHHHCGNNPVCEALIAASCFERMTRKGKQVEEVGELWEDRFLKSDSVED
jgi:hypothetical protein